VGLFRRFDILISTSRCSAFVAPATGSLACCESHDRCFVRVYGVLHLCQCGGSAGASSSSTNGLCQRATRKARRDWWQAE
jgi:hypothetical protein